MLTEKLSSYDLKTNNNKRLCIFKNNKFSNTESIEINNISVKENKQPL